MTRGLPFRVAIPPPPMEAPRAPRFLMWIALLVVLSWGVCVGAAWAIAWTVRLIAQALA